MTREELASFISNKLFEIEKVYKEYIDNLGSEVVKKNWESRDHFLCLNILDGSNSMMGMVGTYDFDGVEKNVHVVDYDSRYGHLSSSLCEYVENLPDLDNMTPVIREKK